MAEFFSRMGMGIDEAREAESRQRGLEANARGFRATERMGRRAFRDMARRGDTGGAFEMMQNMAKTGYSVVGGYQDGELERMNTGRLGRRLNNLTAGAAGKPATPGTDPATNPISPTPVSPLGSKMSFAQQEAAKREQIAGGPPSQSPLNPRQQFAEDLMRSDLVQSGDPAAMGNAYRRGEALGLGAEKVRGFLENRLSLSPSADSGAGLMDRIAEGRANDASHARGMAMSDPAKIAGKSLFDSAMSRVAAAGQAATADFSANLEPRMLELQDQVEQASQRTDGLIARARRSAIGRENMDANYQSSMSSMADKIGSDKVKRSNNRAHDDEIAATKKKNSLMRSIQNRKPEGGGSALLSGLVKRLNDLRTIDA